MIYVEIIQCTPLVVLMVEEGDKVCTRRKVKKNEFAWIRFARIF